MSTSSTISTSPTGRGRATYAARTVLVTCTCAALVAACGSSGKGTTGSAGTTGTTASGGSTATTAKPTDAKKITIGVVEGVTAGYYTALACGVKEVAATIHASVNVQAPQDFTPADQLPLLNGVIAQHPAAIIVVPTDETSLTATFKEAKSDGIKVVTSDTVISASAAPGLVVSQAHDNNVAGGAAAADALADAVGKKGTVLVLDTTPGVSTTDQRVQGFQQEIKKYSGISVLPVQYYQNSPTTATQITEAAVSAHPSIVGIYDSNLSGGQGTVTGLRSIGKAGKIKVVAWDATPTEVAAVKAGYIDALIASNPTLEGYDAAQQAVNAVEGKPVTFNVYTPFAVITAATINTATAMQAIKSYALAANGSCD
jgi:ribose transport system substrate-binding protein